MVLDGLCLVPSVLIIVGFVILVGRGVVMGLPQGPGKVPLCFFLNELLRLFGYPSGSAVALLAGTLPLRHCTTRFASRIPTWRLSVPGHAASLVHLRGVVIMHSLFVSSQTTTTGSNRFV